MRSWLPPFRHREARHAIDRIVLSVTDSERLREIIAKKPGRRAPREAAKRPVWGWLAIAAAALVVTAILSSQPDWRAWIRAAASGVAQTVLEVLGAVQ